MPTEKAYQITASREYDGQIVMLASDGEGWVVLLGSLKDGQSLTFRGSDLSLTFPVILHSAIPQSTGNLRWSNVGGGGSSHKFALVVVGSSHSSTSQIERCQLVR